MTYVPKYILKRLIANDAMKLDGNNISITVLNVLTPIPFGEIPGDILTLLEIKVNDQILVDHSTKEMAAKSSIIHKDKTYPLAKIKEIGGGVLPVGDTFKITFPNIKDYKKGQNYKVNFTLKLDSPISIEFERVLQ